MTNFPMTIKYTDTKEVKVISKPEELQHGREFVVIARNIKWGRKVIPDSRQPEDGPLA